MNIFEFFKQSLTLRGPGVPELRMAKIEFYVVSDSRGEPIALYRFKKYYS